MYYSLVMEQTQTTPPQSTFRLLTAHEVAALLGLKVKTVYSLAEQGIIPRVKIGSMVRFNLVKLNEWIEAGGTDRQTETRQAK